MLKKQVEMIPVHVEVGKNIKNVMANDTLYLSLH